MIEIDMGSTAHFAAGDGQDQLFVGAGNNILKFGESLTADKMHVESTKGGAIITFEGSTDKIAVDFTGQDRSLTVSFQDGTTQVVKGLKPYNIAAATAEARAAAYKEF
jgi:hypothetical protein